jgi:hypothetical protein
VINDLYAKDISKKVRSALDMKKKKRKFIGAYPHVRVHNKDPNQKGKAFSRRASAPSGGGEIFIPSFPARQWGRSQGN